jgi:hypothetical protein
MPILSSEILPEHGPYIGLAAFPNPLCIDDGEWPDRSMYQEHLFFNLADALVDTLCSVSRSYLFFDPYSFTQFVSCERAYGFVAAVLTMASRIASCPIHHFSHETSIYEGSTIPQDARTEHHLKADISETLIFIAKRSAASIRNGKCLAIIGY